jgi:hypothetical protein
MDKIEKPPKERRETGISKGAKNKINTILYIPYNNI